MSPCGHVAAVELPWPRCTTHAGAVQNSLIVCWIAASSLVAEKAPEGEAGRIEATVYFGVKACCATFLYARMHSSTVIPSRPSMMAMILRTG